MAEYLYDLLHAKAKATDITLLTLKPSNQKIDYQAGQYIEAKLDADHWLPLSIANAPDKDGLLEFHLRHNANHPFAEKLLKTLIEKKTIMLRGPYGHCTLSHVPKQSPILFVAGGTGFAPIKALLEEALLNKPIPNSLSLYWGISHPLDAYAEETLKAWQLAFPHFHYQLVLSTMALSDWKGQTGWVHEFVIKEHPALENFCVFASGPYPMVQRAFSLFTQHGLKQTLFFSDLPL